MINGREIKEEMVVEIQKKIGEGERRRSRLVKGPI